MGNEREQLGSRLGFILLSAGCAIGVGNVWKFPWMVGSYGGASFVLVYLICLLILGLPAMTMEFSIGRAAQTSPARMMRQLEKPGQKWHVYGIFAFLGNFLLMGFYTMIAGWFVYYCIEFLIGNGQSLDFFTMAAVPAIDWGYTLVIIAAAFFILCFDLQKGLEKVSKIMMPMLFVLMLALAIRSCTLSGAAQGLEFYLKPDFSKINGQVIVAAMNQAFFTLSLGIGSMAIFGSYIGKDHSLMGESVRIIGLDTLAALLAGFIIFPACTTYGVEPDAGPTLLLVTMTKVFNNMEAGSVWGALFFLFMIFAAFSTVLAVCENLLAMVREKTGWSRVKGAIICGLAVLALATPTALGTAGEFGTAPFATKFWVFFAEGNFYDFFVSNNFLPLGSLLYVIFCSNKFGWGWDNFKAEANTGRGLKVHDWMHPYCKYVYPLIIIFIYLYGMITYTWPWIPK